MKTNKLIDIGRLSAALLLSALYSVFFNSPYYSAIIGGDYKIVAIAVAASALQVLPLWYILMLNRWVFLVLGSFIMITSAALSYYVINYKIAISVGLMRVIMNAESREVRGFFELNAVKFALTALLLCIGGFFFLSKSKQKNTLIKFAGAVAVCAALTGLGKAVQPPVMKKNICMPYVYLEHFYHYLLEEHRINSFIKDKTDISEEYPFTKENEEENQITVLIIGESARSGNFHFNGYEKDTTPKMDTLDILSFKNALSCHILTAQSVTCMLTRATLANWDDSLKETTFISVFRKLGYQTYWISNQGRIGHDKWVGSVALESEYIYFCDDEKKVSGGNLDTCMLPAYKKAVENGNENKLIILHMFGSHLRYDDRYPEENTIFNPVCDKSKDFSECTGEKLINVYDNSIIETDSFIFEVIKELENKNAMVIFISDHAEPLGENGVRARSNLSSQIERHIPFTVWLNGNPKSRHYDTVKRNMNKYSGHNNLIHSIFDCNNISSEGFIDKTLSICSEEMVPYNNDPRFKWDDEQN